MSTQTFNRHRPPFFEVHLFDDEETVLQVTLPTVELQEELRATKDDLTALLEGGEDEKRKGIFDLAARLMSCNRNLRKITPENLRKQYRLVEDDVVAFFHDYVDFITRVESAKN